MQAIQPVLDSRGKDEELARLAWALTHRARVRILRILLARQRCICGELVGQMPLAQSTGSATAMVIAIRPRLVRRPLTLSANP